MFILPFNRDNSVRTIPWILISLIMANTLVLVATYLFFSPEVLFKQYGFVTAHPTLSGLFGSMFLHSGFWHWFGNMWFLWMFGVRVENMFGKLLFALVYLASGVGGAFLHLVFYPSSSVPCV